MFIAKNLSLFEVGPVHPAVVENLTLWDKENEWVTACRYLGVHFTPAKMLLICLYRLVSYMRFCNSRQ